MAVTFEEILESVSKVNSDGSLELYNMIMDSIETNVNHLQVIKLMDIVIYNKSPYARVGYNMSRIIKGIYRLGVFLYLDNNKLKFKVLSNPSGNVLNGCLDVTSKFGDPEIYPEHPDKNYWLDPIPKELDNLVQKGIYEICLHMLEFGNIILKKQKELQKEMEDLSRLSMMSKEEKVLKNWGVIQ